MPRHPLKASAAFFDYDNDGWLDLFVTHYFDWTFAENEDDWCGRREPGLPHLLRPGRLQAAAERRSCATTATGRSPTSPSEVGLEPARRARGWASPSPTTTATGAWTSSSPTTRCPTSSTATTPDGTFSEVAFEAGVAANETGAMVSGMGCDFKDFDNDGWPDIFLTDLVAGLLHALRQPGQGLLHRPHVPVRRSARPRRPQRLEHEVPRHRQRRLEGHLRRRLARGRQRRALQPRRRSTRRAASCTATWARAGSRISPSASAPTSGRRRLARAWRSPTSTTTARWRWPSRGSTGRPRSS